MEFIRSVFDKRHIKLLISALVSLFLGLILVVIGKNITSKIKDQQFVSRWSHDNSTAQVSAFFSELSEFNEENIYELEYQISSKLTQDSISTQNENARLWIDAYSSNGKAVIASLQNEIEVRAIGVGGDFFMFHPMELLSGSFFDGDDVMQDLVVIDEETAWELFGSTDIVGQDVFLNEHRHVVSGVVKKDTGRLNELSGNSDKVIFLSYGSLKENGFASYINCYEAILPNPLTDYARTTLEGQLSIDASRVSVIENSGRYHWTKLVKKIKEFGVRGMNPKGLVYPYWENIARGYEDYLTPVALLGVILFAYPAFFLFCLLIRMWIKRTIHGEDIKAFFEDVAERSREKRKEKKKKSSGVMSSEEK